MRRKRGKFALSVGKNIALTTISSLTFLVGTRIVNDQDITDIRYMDFDIRYCKSIEDDKETVKKAWNFYDIENNQLVRPQIFDTSNLDYALTSWFLPHYATLFDTDNAFTLKKRKA